MGANERLEYLHDKTLKLTTQSGCYIMKDKKGVIIYIGKAKNLKNRVSSYFRLHARHDMKTQKMVDNVFDYDYVVTGSEFEALVLECSLIKLHAPKYNILLKDDKGYHYIKVSNEPYGRITAEMQKVEDGSTYFGPYTSSFAVRQSVEEANRVFMLPVCTRKFPQDFGKHRPCLNFHIKQCSGVCRGRTTQEDHRAVLEDAIAYLRKDSAQTIKSLQQEMEKAAEGLAFEKAAKLRDRIAAIRRINENQKVVFTTAADQDVVALAKRGAVGCAVILKFRKGRLVDKVDYQLGEIGPLEEAREDFVNLYYTNNRDLIPRQISLDGAIENLELTAQLLSEQLGKKVAVMIPQKGEQRRLAEMAIQNAAEVISWGHDISGRDLAALDELARLLGLPNTPLYIEAYDISNLGSSNMVAGMVVFENGRPNKRMYKRFSIKTLDQQNDYGAMEEVITRRLNRYLEEKDSEEGFGKLPDLILLDGGKGHVSTVRPVVEQFGLAIPVFGMVKDDRHRTRAIAEDGGEIAIKSNRSAFTLVYKIQEEVHRFAIEYQQKTHKKAAIGSSLTQIETVGPIRAKNLMKHFKTIKAISEADVGELCKAPGVTRQSAEMIYQHFHN